MTLGALFLSKPSYPNVFSVSIGLPIFSIDCLGAAVGTDGSVEGWIDIHCGEGPFAAD